MNEIMDMDAWLEGEFAPIAVYFPDADCVEYVAEDTVCVHRRIDELLTLIYDETNMIPVGFKLKGFKQLLDRMRARLRLSDDEFVEMVRVFEAIFCDLGDEIFRQDPSRGSAYAAAKKMARDVKLYDLPKAA